MFDCIAAAGAWGVGRGEPHFHVAPGFPLGPGCDRACGCVSVSMGHLISVVLLRET